MVPSPSARDDAPTESDGDSTPATLLLVAAALACGLIAAWALGGAGFAAVETVLVGGVAAAAAYACLDYLATRAAAE